MVGVSKEEFWGAMAELCADKETDFRAILPFLRKLPRHIDMLRFFDRASYYSLHGHDAHTVAAEYFKSSACVRYTGSREDRQAYLTFNKKMGAEIVETVDACTHLFTEKASRT